LNPAKRFVKAHTSKAFRKAVREAREERRLFKIHRSALKKVQACLQGKENKLNLGCGPNPKPGWINIDFFDPRADLQLDLREQWPFADASISRIYSEHVFEHFEFDGEVPHFLSEAFRILQPGGVFDVGVPDTEWPLRAYGNPRDPYWPFSRTVHPETCETQLDHINYHFRQGVEHKYAWDCETLSRTLQKFGFTDVTRREFDPAVDAESRRTGTLYMTATKP
jgi:predicted SAM-dependent methyltransferase